MKRIRIAAWASVVLLLIAAGAAYVLRPNFGTLRGSLPMAAGIGGPFELTTHEGKRLSSADLKGTPFALFFGFTHCPDVCPTTMLELSNAIKELGLYIDVAKISTKVDQVADTFYVRDIFGQKIKDEKKLEEIRTTLLEVLERDSLA